MRERWEMDKKSSASYKLDPRYTASGANWCGERQPTPRRTTEQRRRSTRRARPHTAAVRGVGDKLGLEVLKAHFEHRRSR